MALHSASTYDCSHRESQAIILPTVVFMGSRSAPQLLSPLSRAALSRFDTKLSTHQYPAWQHFQALHVDLDVISIDKFDARSLHVSLPHLFPCGSLQVEDSRKRKLFRTFERECVSKTVSSRNPISDNHSDYPPCVHIERSFDSCGLLASFEIVGLARIS